MRNLSGILVAIVLVLVGIGVVRPQTKRLIGEAWAPVLAERIEFSLSGDEPVELPQTGDYVIFIEGPAEHPLWESAEGQWLQLVDWQSGRPLAGGKHGADFAYEHDGKRVQSLSRITVPRTGKYEVNVGRNATIELKAAGFQAVLSPAKLVTDQSRMATTWFVAGCAAGLFLGVIALAMLTRAPG
jgi:hypothetical protein